MNALVLLTILSHCWSISSQDTTAVNSDGEDNVPETSIASFALAGSTEANRLNPTMDATVESEIDSINLVPVGTSAPQQTKLTPTATAAATDSVPAVPSDTTRPDMAATSTPVGTAREALTRSPAKTLDTIETTSGHLDGTLRTTPSASTKSPPVEAPEMDTNARSRSSRQTLYSNTAFAASQRLPPRKGSFETTRGKNWCAYVHTRLSPSVTTDNVETFISAVKDPCAAKMGGCPIRYQMVTRPTYRMKHKLVTSLEWKCCPGYSGEKCQLTVLRYQMVMHENQAESNNAINGGPSVDPHQPALLQKMSEQIYNQEMKLTSLQQKMDNISHTMNEMHSSVSSLEEKLNDETPVKSVQAFLKDLKSKTITELVKDIVREQMKGFQTDMLQMFGQVFKTISGLSVEVESTKESIKNLNDTVASISAHQKLLIEQEPRPTMADILELKFQIADAKAEITSICESSLRDLHENQESLAAELEREQFRSSTYYESLNTTLLKIRQVQDQLLSGEGAKDILIPTLDISREDNVTEYLISLQEKVKRQSFMMVQLYEDISAQDSKINNFTITLELQKDSIQKACEARLSKCRKDFESKIKSTEEHVNVLNKTMSDVVLPMDDKIDKMNEQINDLCYDMEILQPLIEHGAPFSMSNDYGHQNDVAIVNRQLEEINAVVYGLTSNIQELTKGQEALRAETQAQDQVFERRVAACIVDIEDGLNNTMTVLNNAVDFIQDNYVPKETLSSLQNDSQLLTQTVQRVDSLLELIPQLNQLNESVKILSDELLKKENALNSTGPLSKESANIVSFFKTFNETAMKVDQCHENVSHLEDKLQQFTQEKLDCATRLKSFESQISQMLANFTISTKPKNGSIIPKQKEQPAYPKYQELSSRVKALEAKSIRLSLSMPLLNKTVYENRDSCQRAFIMIQSVNDSMSQWIRNMQPNISVLHKIMKELVTSGTDQVTENIWSNLTAYIDKSTADVTGNVAKLQKQMKLVIKKTVSPKTAQTNGTAPLVGRNQRNTDSTAEQDDSSSCNISPCHNGGTCINDRDSFVCACRHPFGGVNCSVKMSEENTLAPDFSKGSYRYAPMVTFFVSHTYGMTVPGPIRFNNLYVNYGASYAPSTGKFNVPYLGVYVFKYTIESFSPRMSGYLVVDGVDKLAFQSESINSSQYSDRVITGDALLELNYGQQVDTRPPLWPSVYKFMHITAGSDSVCGGTIGLPVDH